MKSLFIVFFTIIISVVINAQVRVPSEIRLKAQRVKNFIHLSFKEDDRKFKYQVDPKKPFILTQHSFFENDETQFAVDNSSANIATDFLNPLRYSLTLKVNYIDDNLYENSDKYLKQFQNLLTYMPKTKNLDNTLSIQLQTQSEKVKDIDSKFLNNDTLNRIIELQPGATFSIPYDIKKIDKKDTTYNNLNILTKDVSYLSDIHSSELFTWIISIYSNRNNFQRNNKFKDSIEFIPKYQTLLKLLNKDEVSLFGNENELNINKEIKKSFSTIYNANTFLDFKKSIDDLDKLITDRVKILDEIDNNQTEIISQLNSNFRMILKPISASVDDDTKTNVYNARTQQTIRGYLKNISQIVQQQRNTFNSIMAFVKATRKIKPVDDEYSGFFLTEIKPMPKKIAEVTISVKKINLKSSDDDNSLYLEEEQGYVSTTKLDFVEYSFIVPEFSIGTLFSNIDYPTYSVDSTNTIVKTTKNTFQSLSANMNLVMDWGRSDVYPFLQVGISANSFNTPPSVNLGLGIRQFRLSNFAVSIGALWYWYKDLNVLRVGEKSDQAKINSDTENNVIFQAKPKLYLGFQYNF